MKLKIAIVTISLLLLELAAGFYLKFDFAHRGVEGRNDVIEYSRSQINGYYTLDYHPYLGLVEPGAPPLLALRSAPRPFRIAFLGGSFATELYVSSQSHSPIADKFSSQLKEHFQKLGWQGVEFYNLALVGAKQPRQLVASLMYLNSVDLFISIEGFADSVAINGSCLSQIYPPFAHRFDPRLSSPFQTAAKMNRGVFNGLLWLMEHGGNHSSLATLGFQLIQSRQISLMKTLEYKHSQWVSRSCQGTSNQEKFEESTDIWFQFLQEQHQLLNSGQVPRLLTFIQPNLYLGTTVALNPKLENDEMSISESTQREWASGYRLGVDKVRPLLHKYEYIYDSTEALNDLPNTIYKDKIGHLTDAGYQAYFDRILPQILTATKNRRPE